MSILRQVFGNGTLRAFALLGLLICGFWGLASAGRVHLGPETVFSVLQNFATYGPVALGLGLTMLVREFDISIAGTFSLGSCVAVLVGAVDPALGIIAALLVGLVGGFTQGVLIVRLQLGSVAVSLGGLLTFSGIAYVLTGNQSVSFGNLDVAMAMNAPILGLFSIRSLAALSVFAIAAVIVSYTRIGRDMIAAGSDRQASAMAGVAIEPLVVGAFATSGILSAGSGALLSYSLAAASPAGLSDVTVPAIAAVILGGASLLGGAGRPLGTAAGMLILSLLQTGLTALGFPPFVQELVTGTVLLVVAISDGPDLVRRLHAASKLRRSRLARRGDLSKCSGATSS
jgi:ribose/xylose/arabinose/galactoside ABC-type transport system permease subunit